MREDGREQAEKVIYGVAAFLGVVTLAAVFTVITLVLWFYGAWSIRVETFFISLSILLVVSFLGCAAWREWDEMSGDLDD